MDIRTEELCKRADALNPNDAKIFLSYMSDEMLMEEIARRLYERRETLDDIGGLIIGKQ